jgi:hypothetical protein
MEKRVLICRRGFIFPGALVLAALLLPAGCAGTKDLGVLDPSLPEERQCPLEIRDNLSVIMYDNQPVEWIPGFDQNKVDIVLPAGQHSFVVKYYTTTGSQYHTTTQAHTVIINQEFLPGHSYRIYQIRIWLIFFTIINTRIKDLTPRAGTA